MKSTQDVNRRNVLRSLSAGIVGGGVLVGNAAGRRQEAFGFIQKESEIAGETVKLTEKRGREKVECVYGERYSTMVWKVTFDGESGTVHEYLALLSSGFKEGDELAVSDPWHECSGEFKEEVRVELVVD